MWFKNLAVYRLPAGWSVKADDFERKLSQYPLKPCGGFDMESRGWTSPRDDGAFLYHHQHQWLLALGVEQKLLPASVIRQQAKERADKIAQRQGHPVGRKQLRDIRDKVASELLPRALARRRTTRGWIAAEKAGWRWTQRRMEVPSSSWRPCAAPTRRYPAFDWRRSVRRPRPWRTG
jgi:recombination associated protein RdgC